MRRTGLYNIRSATDRVGVDLILLPRQPAIHSDVQGVFATRPPTLVFELLAASVSFCLIFLSYTGAGSLRLVVVVYCAQTPRNTLSPLRGGRAHYSDMHDRNACKGVQHNRIADVP